MANLLQTLIRTKEFIDKVIQGQMAIEPQLHPNTRPSMVQLAQEILAWGSMSIELGKVIHDDQMWDVPKLMGEMAAMLVRMKQSRYGDVQEMLTIIVGGTPYEEQAQKEFKEEFGIFDSAAKLIEAMKETNDQGNPLYVLPEDIELQYWMLNVYVTGIFKDVQKVSVHSEAHEEIAVAKLTGDGEIMHDTWKEVG